MKKLFLLIMASMVTIFMMAAGTGDGSTKANAIEFDWDKGNVHPGGTLWYHVDLAPLYEEDNPALTLNVANPSRDKSVKASMMATIAGQTQTKNYTVSPHEHQSFSEEASALVFMRQTEIYLTLTTDGEVLLSAKVYESTDLDETCKNAKELKWDVEATQTKGYAAWWKVNLSNIKDTVNFSKKDARVTITNIGNGTVNLKAGQSLDCPSSGLNKRNFTLLAGQSIVDTIPQSMILSVFPDELYFSIENVEQPVKIKVEMVDRPSVPVISDKETFVDLHVTDTITPLLIGKTYYRIKVAEMDSLAKFEPEFTYRNVGTNDAKVTVKMAFEVPAFGSTNSSYDLSAGEEQIVVYKKNMLENLEGIEYIYLLTEVQGSDVNFYGRFKHVREGKACKTNIDFNWENGHVQEARTTQWYAVNIADARDNIQDIEVHLVNYGSESAKVKASLAFSCPYIDLQEVSHSIPVGKEEVRTLRYSSYAMMSDTVWIGLETNRDIKFWATTKPAKTKEPDAACEKATPFSWENGVVQKKDTTVWYVINMEEARQQAAKYPTVVVQNMSSTNEVKITAELSLECPDSIENQSRELVIPAKGAYSKQIARNLFENISQKEIYLRVTTTEEVSMQIRLTQEAAGTSCSSAIPFNWVSGNTQAANANLWYSVDLHAVIENGSDVKVHLQNRDKAECTGFVQLAYSCPFEDATSIRNFTLAPNDEKEAVIPNSAIEAMTNGLVYVNIQGSTSLRFWAEAQAPEPFDTIYPDGINLTELKWNETYTQTEDTAWYLIPKSEIDYVRNLEEKMTPVAHLIDASASAKTVRAEAAFAFPIGKRMMGKSKELKANQHFFDTVPAGTFDQVLNPDMKRDSIILRVIRTKGTGAFQFKAELVKAFNGNSPRDAVPVRLNALYTQGANTEMWYKVKTETLKQDKNLFNKVLRVMGKNAGKGDTKVKVAVYEGYKAKYEEKDDLLMNRGEKTIKKGLSKSHNIPAQAIYAVGDSIELYIKVRTTDSLVFETKFVGEYAPLENIDPDQQKAKLVVPNVEYTIKGDNQAHWYQICIPYIQNNYKYIDNALDSTNLEYELEGTATIEVTATFQDTMDCKMPVRQRTINKSNKSYKGRKSLRSLIEKAIKKAGHTFDLSSTDPAFIDSMLHRFITKDSITLYVRVKSDKEIKAKLNTPQTKGDDCINAMSFDWEHGNVNPKDQHTWYVVALDTTQLYKENKGLRLHVDNWSETNASDVSASLYFKCDDKSQGDISKTIAANDSLTKDISLDFIKASSPQLMFIEFHSTEVTHIWIEKVDVKHDTVYADTTFFVCKGASVLGHVINEDTEWNDTIRNIKDEQKLALYDSITTIHAFVLHEPQVYDVSSLVNIERGAVLDLAAADTWLKEQYAADDNDTIQNLTSIKWQYAVYPDETFKDVDLANQPIIASERIKVRYFAFTECTEGLDPDPSKGLVVYKNYLNIARDTAKVDTCNYYTWPENDSLYVLPTTANPDSVVFPGGVNWGDSVLYLSLTLSNPAKMDLPYEVMYGNRLLVLNRNKINQTAGWENVLDSIYTPGGKVKVEWFNANDPNTPLTNPNYYYNNLDGSPLVGTFYAVITVDNGSACGLYGRTPDIVLGNVASGIAPVLAPSIVMPGEDIKVLNLDPEKETIIRIFTTEGLLQHTYNVSGQETFTIKAANAQGFYLVELLSGNEKSALRYIVK